MVRVSCAFSRMKAEYRFSPQSLEIQNRCAAASSFMIL